MQIFSDTVPTSRLWSLSITVLGRAVHRLRAALAARSARRSSAASSRRDVDLDTRTELAQVLYLHNRVAASAACRFLKSLSSVSRRGAARARAPGFPFFFDLSGSAVPTRHATANNITYFDAFTFNVTARGASQRGQPRRAPSRAVAEGCWSAVDGRGEIDLVRVRVGLGLSVVG
eukprot:scaffold2880_cov67-Phaeocystis_antarctica.AAC.1